MLVFLKNLSALTRPLSNVKNIAVILLACFLYEIVPAPHVLLMGFLSLSFVCSAVYAFNSWQDLEADSINRNKTHYSESVFYFGQNSVLFIILVLVSAGVIFGFLINWHFVVSLLLLLLAGFSYSYKKIRLKEIPVLGFFIGGIFPILFRFSAAWSMLALSFPPVSFLIILFFLKTGGFLLYKEIDRDYLLKQKSTSIVRLFGKKTNAIISNSFLISAFIVFYLIFSERFPLFWFVWTVILAFVPFLVINLKIFNKIKTESKKLRMAGFIYFVLILILAFLFS